jgi:hypothetical protein
MCAGMNTTSLDATTRRWCWKSVNTNRMADNKIGGCMNPAPTAPGSSSASVPLSSVADRFGTPAYIYGRARILEISTASSGLASVTHPLLRSKTSI